MEKKEELIESYLKKEINTELTQTILKLYNKEIKEYDVDHHLRKIIEYLKKTSREDKAIILLDWLNESITREKHLMSKAKVSTDKYRANIILILISKCKIIHNKIMEFIINELDLYYDVWHDQQLLNNLELANLTKLMAVEFANKIIINLTDNREINEEIYDHYIDIVSQSLQSFN